MTRRADQSCVSHQKEPEKERILAELRARILLAERPAAPRAVLPFGLPVIDACLPGGGLLAGALHEVAAAGADAVTGAAAAAFLAGIAGRMEGAVLWCGGADLFPPGLAGAGLGPDRVLFAEAGSDLERLAVLEEAARDGGLAAAIAEVRVVSDVASRRVQHAAERTGTSVFILKRRREGREAVTGGSAAATRWRVSPMPSPPLPHPGIGRARWFLELWRVRGGKPGAWIVEGSDASGCLALSAGMADGSVAPPHRRAA